MSTSIEQKVVELKFNNAEFQQRMAASLKALQDLNKGLKFEGATKGFQDVSAASKNLNLGHVESGVQNIADRFKAMSVIAITALSTIAHRAVLTGATLVKSLTIDPIKQGLQEYETNLNSIQTILANTGLEGSAGLQKVTDALDQLNLYSDQTIYNFSQMARNIGTFTAAGVKLDVATAAIKGIANLAAISGSNAEQASAAMYQLSQALAAGKLTLIDWNSVVNAGMGGKVFQDALMATARVHGVAIDKMVKDAGGFRASLEKGWITSDILTETLSKFTGDLTAEQLKQMGYTEQQIAGILKMGKTAQDAATKVKTATQLINTLQESVTSGWAKTWQLVVGDFDEARELFTGINDVLGEFIGKSADTRNQLLSDWKEMGGRTVLIEAIKNAWQALVAVVTPIKDAFREIFPATTAKQLYDITVSLRNFTSSLKISADTGMNLRRTFAGIFALLDLGWMVVREGIKFLLRLFGVVTEGSGGILEFTGNVGDLIVGLRNAIKQGKGIEKFFDTLGDIIEPPIRLLKAIARLIGGLFDGFSGSATADRIIAFMDKITSFETIGGKIAFAWEKVLSVLGKVFTFFHKTAGSIDQFLGGFSENVATSFQGFNLSELFAGLGTSALAAFILTIRGLVSNASNVIESLTDALGSMQNTLRAATLLQIAIAIGVLAAAVKVLSTLNAQQLTQSLTAITAMFIQLMGAMLIFEKLSGFTGFAKMPFVAASMILLGAAINILAAAVKNLSTLDWEELGRGLTGVTALLAAVIATAKLMPPTSGLFSTALAMILLGAALHVLVGAVTDLAALSWEELAKGLISVGALLAALTLFSRFTQANALGLLSGAGILLLAVAINLLAEPLKEFAQMSWHEIGKGLAVLAGALTAIGLAISLIPPTAIFSAAGVLIAATALGMIADGVQKMSELSWSEIGRGLTVMAAALAAIGAALFFIPPTAILSAEGIGRAAGSLSTIGKAIKEMGQMSWEEIAKGLVTLGGALLLIVIALKVMTGALAGAAALLIVAASLAILAPVLLLFSKMSWGEIAAGLGMLAGVFVVLGLAGLVLTPVIGTLFLLGTAITLLGVGIVLAGAGLLMFSAALTALAIAGTAGVTALVAMVGALAGLIPEVMKQIGLGLKAFLVTVSQAAPAMINAVVNIIIALLDAIQKLAPKIMETVAILITKLLDTLLKYAPHLVDTGLKLLVAFIQGIANNIDKVVNAAVNLAVNFLDAIERHRPRLIQKGVDYVIGFINGLASAIRDNSARMGEAGVNLATAMIEGMIRGLGAGLGKLIQKAKDVATSAINAAKNALGIGSPSKEFAELGMWSDRGLAVGLAMHSGLVEGAAADVGNRAIDSLRLVLTRIPDILNEEMTDVKPIITPVLDLNELRKDASEIGAFLDTSTSFRSALVAAAGARVRPQDAEEDSSASGATTIYNQNNYSPKALSTAEIYRRTKNQLSTVKGGLPT